MAQLSSRQWALYCYLREKGDQWCKQEDIASDLYEWYPFTEFNFHDSRARSLMTMDIRAINVSAVIDKIIISSPCGIKLANDDEFARYIRNEYRSVFNKLKRIRVKERKGRMDGQARMGYESEIEVIEAFLREK